MEPLSRNYETHFSLGTKKKGGDQIGRMGSIADRSIQRRRKAKKKTSVAVGKPKKKNQKKREEEGAASALRHCRSAASALETVPDNGRPAFFRISRLGPFVK